jgi:uncharacterized membrane protein YdjX (TVP38/TMEM64 family)
MEITVWDFALWVGLGSLPNIFLCCAIGNRLIRGDWLLSIVYFVVMLSIVIVMWKFQDRVLGLYRRIVRPKNKDDDGG